MGGDALLSADGLAYSRAAAAALAAREGARGATLLTGTLRRYASPPPTTTTHLPPPPLPTDAPSPRARCLSTVSQRLDLLRRYAQVVEMLRPSLRPSSTSQARCLTPLPCCAPRLRTPPPPPPFS